MVEGHSGGRFFTCLPERRPASGGVASKAAPHAEIRRFFNGIEGGRWPHSGGMGTPWKKGGVLGGTIAPEKAALTLFKHGVVIVPGARRARLDRRGAAREGSVAAASSAAGGNTSAIAELLAVAQL